MEKRYVITTGDRLAVNYNENQCFLYSEIVKAGDNIGLLADSFEDYIMDELVKMSESARDRDVISFFMSLNLIFDEEYVKSLNGKNGSIFQLPSVVKSAILPGYFCASLYSGRVGIDSRDRIGFTKMDEIIKEMRRRGYNISVHYDDGVRGVYGIADKISEHVINLPGDALIYKNPTTIILNVFNGRILNQNFFDFSSGELKKPNKEVTYKHRVLDKDETFNRFKNV